MTNKEFEVKEYLSQAYYLELKMNNCMNELERIRAMMVKSSSIVITGKNDGMRRNRTEELLVKFMDYTTRLEKGIDKYSKKLVEISDAINLVEDEKSQLVLFMRYIQHKSWESICSTMHYERRWIFNLHLMGLKELVNKKVCTKMH